MLGTRGSAWDARVDRPRSGRRRRRLRHRALDAVDRAARPVPDRRGPLEERDPALRADAVVADAPTANSSSSPAYRPCTPTHVSPPVPRVRRALKDTAATCTRQPGRGGGRSPRPRAWVEPQSLVHRVACSHDRAATRSHLRAPSPGSARRAGRAGEGDGREVLGEDLPSVAMRVMTTCTALPWDRRADDRAPREDALQDQVAALGLRARSQARSAPRPGGSCSRRTCCGGCPACWRRPRRGRSRSRDPAEDAPVAVAG